LLPNVEVDVHELRGAVRGVDRPRDGRVRWGWTQPESCP